MSRLCLGGTFNPIHHAHLICARFADEAIGADEVVLIPAANPPHKPPGGPLGGTPVGAAERLAMCRLAVDGVPGFSVDDREIRRGGASYTIQTVRELREEGQTVVNWLIGADLVAGLPAWHDAARLVEECHFIIVARPGWSIDWHLLPAPFARLEKQVVVAPLIDISASQIRSRVAAGRDIQFLTPPAVCRFIEQRGLYRNDAHVPQPV